VRDDHALGNVRQSSLSPAPELRAHGFDDFVKGQRASFCAETIGRPGLLPGIYSGC
jgi:hypothetical protein